MNEEKEELIGFILSDGMVWDTVKVMRKASRFQLLWVSILISFLLFLVNIVGIVAYNVGEFTHEVRQKLGVYLYLKDDTKRKDEVYGKAIELMKELKENGMTVVFYSKEEAFELLEKKLPSIISNLEKYGIKNPLPATIYVMFSTKEQFASLKRAMVKYESIITNLDEIQEGMNFEQQEQKAAHVISLTSTAVWFSWFLIAMIVTIIVVVLVYMIHINFFTFAKQIEVEKLLGASFGMIKRPFLLLVPGVLGAACLAHLLYFAVGMAYVNKYFVSVFAEPVYSMLLPDASSVLVFLLAELLGMLLLTTLVVDRWLSVLIKKI